MRSCIEDPASNRAVVAWAQLEPDMRVLDIGCGTGAAVSAAARLLPGGQVVGVDPSSDFVRVARRRSHKILNASFHVATAEELPFDGETFDVVWSVDSTHHWHRLGAGIGEAARVLRPSGRFLIVERHDPRRPWGINSTRRTTSQRQLLQPVSLMWESKNAGLVEPASFSFEGTGVDRTNGLNSTTPHTCWIRCSALLPEFERLPGDGEINLTR